MNIIHAINIVLTVIAFGLYIRLFLKILKAKGLKAIKYSFLYVITVLVAGMFFTAAFYILFFLDIVSKAVQRDLLLLALLVGDILLIIAFTAFLKVDKKGD